MTITPFLALKVRGKKDAVLARQRARRVASLLSFDPQEQACIAAGTFVIACQALTVFGKARLCFQIENGRLDIFAEPRQAPESGEGRLAGLFAEGDPKSLFRLTKQLPPREVAADEIELGWLIKKVEEAACESVFDEIVKQNQEMLALLHELRLYRGDLSQKEKKPANPHAA